MAHIQICSGDAGSDRLDRYLHPDLALYFLAEARISLGQFGEAVAAPKQRLERNPNSETSYALLRATVTSAELPKAERPGRRS